MIITINKREKQTTTNSEEIQYDWAFQFDKNELPDDNNPKEIGYKYKGWMVTDLIGQIKGVMCTVGYTREHVAAVHCHITNWWRTIEIKGTKITKSKTRGKYHWYVLERGGEDTYDGWLNVDEDGLVVVYTKSGEQSDNVEEAVMRHYIREIL